MDEMSVQADLQFYSRENKTYIIGFNDMDSESPFVEISNKEIRSSTSNSCSSVCFPRLQWFPIFYFPTTQASTSDLYILTWEIINMLQLFGFTVRYIRTDGVQTNRDIRRILLGDFKSETVSTMRIPNIYSQKSPPPIVFIMHFSHVIKKN